MTPLSWQQIEDAFHRAHELAPAERAAFLDELRVRDRALHEEVVALLESEPVADDILRTTITAGAAELMTDAAEARIGARLGPYRLVELLGEGGMGCVYRAVRDDAEYRSEVAVKVLRLGLGSAHAIARFRDERQILAALDHPGIVRLLDGNSTEGGVPYLVLEYVEGVPITRYARDRGASVEARIQLLLHVCEAVQYAHQRLVVHRDIKPSNILVGERGQPKLLDFGIAKLIDPARGREAWTRTGMALLTPEYASPEQARGEAVSTATDVYSLGAVLYDLLADQSPHPATANALEALRVICEVEPPRPSSVAPAERRSRIAGDLDNIVQKALNKEPARRYASVEQLADDLRRHLDGQPVAARAATVGYRAHKFLRRHRGKVALAGVATAALFASTVWSLREAHRADRETERAEHRFAEGRKLANTLVFEIEAQIRKLKGSTATRELILRSALGYLDGLAGDASDDPELSRELALAYMKLGDIQGDTYDSNLGRARDAIVSYGKAHALLDRMKEQRDAPATRRALATCLLGTGLTHHALGDLPRAAAIMREGLAIAEALPAGDEVEPTILLRGYNALVYLDEPAAAERDAARSQEVAQHWLAREPASAEARYWKLILIETGAGLVANRDPQRAVSELREAVTLASSLVSEHPDDPRYARELAVGEVMLSGNLGGIGGAMLWLPNIGDVDGAIAVTREAIPRFEEIGRHDPNDVRARVDLGGVVASLAALIAERDPAEALPVFERALVPFDSLTDTARAEYYTRQMEWFAHCAMSIPLAKLGKREDALAHATRGLALAEGVGSDERGGATLEMCRYMVADTRRLLGDADGAAALLDANIASLESQLARSSPPMSALIGLVASLERMAEVRPAQACSLKQRAARVWRAWAERTPYIEARQAELDRAASCAR